MDAQSNTRYAVVGTGGRCGGMFLLPLATEFKDSSKLVAFCDISRIRMQYWVDELKAVNPDLPQIALFAAEEFDRMLEETKPDTVIVCSVDATHADYIVRSLNAGCDVIVEKPMAVTAQQLVAIREAAEATSRKVHVAFNYRWMPFCTRVKELLLENQIGQVTHVHFEYLLDTKHGADYFRRWHARIENSGGLLVHKATHHFDLVNWWLNSIPETVSANGSLRFYGKENAIARGDAHLTRYDRYLDPASKDDPFRFALLNEGNNHRNVHYHDAEKDSGYIRDRNVFRDDINIHDTMSVIARYRNGAFLTYSLVAYAPYEGFRVHFTGDRGRMELTVNKASHLILAQSDKDLAAQQNNLPKGVKHLELKVHKHFQEAVEIPVPKMEGGHLGADPQLRASLFSPGSEPDPLGRCAGWQQGMVSVLIGLAANESIATGATVPLEQIVPVNNLPSALSALNQ